jgi:4-amino-4-deoxy-L-arabinose transferase-like glycosyltransferase
LLWDERLYHVWASKIANGTYDSRVVFEFAPLPAYVMAAIYKIFSPDPLYVRILNIFLGVLTCWVVYLIGKEMAGKRTGLWVCLVAALYEPFIFYSIVPLKTALSVFLFGMTVYLFLSVFEKQSMSKVFLLGLAVGLMLNVRPHCAVLIPVLPFFFMWRRRESLFTLKKKVIRVGLFFSGLALAVFPFVARNYLVAGKMAITSSQSGFNFYLANHLDNPDPYYRPVPFATSSPFEQGVQFTIEASRRTGKKMSPEEASAYWTREAVHGAFEQPMSFFLRMIRKVLVVFNRFEACDHYHIGFVSKSTPFFRFPFFEFWVVVPFGLAGMLVSAFRTEKLRATATVCLVYAMTLVMFFCNARYRLPLLTVVIPSAVIGISEMWRLIKRRKGKKTIMFAVLVLLCFVGVFLPVHGTDDFSAYYNTHAIILNANGQKKEAIQYWEESSAMQKPYSAFANVSLAGVYLEEGQVDKAHGYLDRISDASFAAAAKYSLLGDVMFAQGRTEAAVEAYEQSLRINFGQRRVRLKLANVLSEIDQKRAAEEYEKLRFVSSFYDLL